jgi:hypothetical protein
MRKRILLSQSREERERERKGFSTEEGDLLERERKGESNVASLFLNSLSQRLSVSSWLYISSWYVKNLKCQNK